MSYNFASLDNVSVEHASNPLALAAAKGIAIGMGGQDNFVSRYQTAASSQAQETSRTR